MQLEGGGTWWGVAASQRKGNDWPEQRVALGDSHGEPLVKPHTRPRRKDKVRERSGLYGVNGRTKCSTLRRFGWEDSST